MSQHASGRHRAPGRFNPLNELTGIVAAAGKPAAKTSAVLVASGGLAASFALPAQAASPTAPQASAPKAAPVAVSAPAVAAPAATTAFGVIGFSATAKPKPKPKPKPVVVEQTDETETQESSQSSQESQGSQRSTGSESRSSESRSSESTASRSTERSSAPAESSAPATGGVVEIAKRYIGTPYRYGGTDPSGFDCSGFTQYVFAQVGISLPRTAEAQRQATTPVSNPQPGDLVFGGNPAYHVGIYVGDGMMIDSPRTGKSIAVRSIWYSNPEFRRAG